MRYADGGGLTAEGRARRENVRLLAARLFEQDVDARRIAKILRVSTKSVYQRRRAWGTAGDAAPASRGPGGRGFGGRPATRAWGRPATRPWRPGVRAGEGLAWLRSLFLTALRRSPRGGGLQVPHPG
jgi:hypothetical protein